VIACDAVTAEDLVAVVRAGMKLETPVVWVGSGGLARALAPELGAGEHPRRRLLTPVRPGPVIIVSGSASDIAREQAARVARAGAVPIELDASGLVANDIRTQNMFGEIREHLSLARDLVMTVTPSANMDDPRISRALGALVAPFRSVVGGLVSTGGDTAAAVLRAWGVTALIVCDEIEPGVPLSIAVGPDPVGVVTKAGAFGDPDTFVRARERLRMLIKSQAVAR
jgi:uncharacterized protein YgbK (DUF1537 family)